MRVTQNSTANNALYNFQLQRTSLDSLQESISSGQNVNRPSDDPIASGVLMDFSDKLKSIDQYSTTITKANTLVKLTDTTMTGMTDIMTQAKKIISTINTGLYDPNASQSAHDQLVDLKKQLIEMGNTQLGDQYIFGGAKSNTPPFSQNSNLYTGDSTQLTVQVSPSTTQAVSMTGDRILKGTTTPPTAPGTLPTYGSTDILQTFDNLITAVGDLTNPANVTALNQGSIDLDAGYKQITNAIGENQTRMMRLSNISTMNDNNKNMMQDIVSNIQNVDMAQLGVELTNQNTAFQASLSATAKISQLSLLDYLT